MATIAKSANNLNILNRQIECHCDGSVMLLGVYKGIFFINFLSKAAKSVVKYTIATAITVVEMENIDIWCN